MQIYEINGTNNKVGQSFFDSTLYHSAHQLARAITLHAHSFRYETAGFFI